MFVLDTYRHNKLITQLYMFSLKGVVLF